MSTMTKDDLFHEPIGGDGTTWAARRRLSAKLDSQIMAFLDAGGQIDVIQHQTIEDLKLSYNNKPTSPEQSAKAGNHMKHSQLNRDLALENGKPTYIGLICKKCRNSYERWTKTKECTTCSPDDPAMNPKTLARAARMAAMQRGEEVYNGRACPVCQTTRKLIDNGNCIQCKGPERYRLRDKP